MGSLTKPSHSLFSGQPRLWVYVFAGALSIALSLWSMTNQVINPDAICYLKSAEGMSIGIGFATHLCDQAHWPFYSLSIFLISKLSQLSYEHSAYLLNSGLSLISIITFIAIIHFFSSSFRTLCLAAIVILCAHHFNVAREYIVRDHGFWAFYLVSLLFLLKCMRDPSNWKYPLAWNASILIATLFRIEGVVFLFALPFITFLIPNKTLSLRCKLFFKLNTLTLFFVCLFLSWVVLYSQVNLDQLGRVAEVKFQLQHGLTKIVERYHSANSILSQYVLSKFAAHQAPLALFLTLMNLYVVNVVGTLSLIYAGLFVYALRLKLPTMSKEAKWVLFSYIALNCFITLIFLFQNMFLSKRYLMALSLTLMLWVPFALNHLLEHWKKYRWQFVLVIFCVGVWGYGGVKKHSDSKMHLSEAGYWLEKNVPSHATMYSNNYQIMYYSNHFGYDIFTKMSEYQNKKIEDVWKNYDFIALHLNKKNHEKYKNSISLLGIPLKVFVSKHGEKVAIYKLQ